MKVMVTGSSGFIGKRTAVALSARGHTAVSYDRPDGDVRDPDALEFACQMGEVEAIINLAGMLGTPELFGSEFEAAEVNILGAINVYDAAARMGIPVVQIGTGHKGQPNPYAITKGCAEDLGLARAQWCGERIAVVRAFHVYGPGQFPGPPHGFAHVHKFFPTFACRALTGMPLELCGGGVQLIDPVYVDDVAGVLADAVDGPYGEVLEAGNGQPVSVAAVARDIAGLVSPDAALLLPVADRQGEPHNADVVAGKPLCEHPWPYLMPETVEWYREWLEPSWLGDPVG